MRLNTLRAAAGSRRDRRRVGRGIGSGLGKTAGRGHKGQKSRSGGFHKIGFEGGQMPLQRRLPKRGFASRIAATRAEVRLSELQALQTETIDLEVLRRTHVVGGNCLRAKVIASGQISKPVTLVGVAVTPGARAAIEAAGGSVVTN